MLPARTPRTRCPYHARARRVVLGELAVKRPTAGSTMSRASSYSQLQRRSLSSGSCSALKSSTIDVALPPRCITSATSATGRFSGFSRQRCVGRSLAAQLALQPSSGDGAYRAAISASVCLARRLMHLRLIDDCHLVAHAIGKAVWQRYAEHHPTSTIADLRRAAATLVPLCPSETCTDGCLHALIIELLAATVRAGHALETSIRPLAEAACGPATRQAAIGGTDYSPMRWDYGCQHGLGHGLGAIAFDGQITDAKAFALCGSMVTRDASMVVSPMTCEGGLQMQLVDSRLEEALSHGNDNALLDGNALYRMCSEIPPDGSEAVDRRRHYMCFGVLGEGLMFSSCHDEGLSLQACDHMNQPAVFGDHRLLTTTAGVRRRLQPDMSSNNVQSPREICTDGVREEGSVLRTWAGAVTNASGCDAPTSTILTPLIMPCVTARGPIDPSTPIGQWCCGDASLIPAGKRTWACRTPAPTERSQTPGFVARTAAASAHARAVSAEPPPVAAAQLSPPSPPPPPESGGGGTAIIVVLLILLIAVAGYLWRRRRLALPPRHQSIGRSLSRTHSHSAWQESARSRRHEKAVKKVLSKQLTPGTFGALKALRRVQVTGQEVGSGLDPAASDHESLPPLSPPLSPLANADPSTVPLSKDRSSGEDGTEIVVTPAPYLTPGSTGYLTPSLA